MVGGDVSSVDCSRLWGNWRVGIGITQLLLQESLNFNMAAIEQEVYEWNVGGKRYYAIVTARCLKCGWVRKGITQSLLQESLNFKMAGIEQRRWVLAYIVYKIIDARQDRTRCYFWWKPTSLAPTPANVAGRETR